MQLINMNGKFLADSREVSAMIGKQHNHLLRDIDGYAKVLTESNFGLNEFFIEGSYQDGRGRSLKLYYMTKKGCDMVANKMTGEKGILFTAAYATKFEEMENRQNSNVEVLDERKQRIVLMKTMIDHDERIDAVEDRIVAIEEKVNEQITLDSGEQRKVQKAVARKIYSIETDEKQRHVFFRQLHREIKDRWAVPSYKDIRKHELDGLMSYIEAWRPIAA